MLARVDLATKTLAIARSDKDARASSSFVIECLFRTYDLAWRVSRRPSINVAFSPLCGTAHQPICWFYHKTATKKLDRVLNRHCGLEYHHSSGLLKALRNLEAPHDPAIVSVDTCHTA